MSDNGFVSNYWYDASGERTVKESFDNEGVYVNGVLSAGRTSTGKFTAYISPYLVVNNGGYYSKHIYMGSERITSKVGNSGIFSSSPVEVLEQQAKYTLQTGKIKERFDSLGVQYKGIQQTGGLVSSNPSPGADSYFYHPDHLGSSSLITNVNGDLVQHIQYVPFGEVFVEETKSAWSTPYKFNAKELDDETGLYYYGARYYDPRTSVWLSVDPLAEKKPWMSSYVYCRDNPINMIDPDGRDEKQRNAAIAKAEEYVEKNPGDSYRMGAKGSPGHKVDCSGLVSNSVKAGGEKDPNNGNANGVKNIESNTHKVDIQDAQTGNIITFSKSKHTGMITEVIKDKKGNVIGFKFIDSGGTEGSGKSGPRNSTAIIGKNYWGSRISGIFKWDTKPDANKSEVNKIPMLLKPYGSSQSLEQTVNNFLNNR